MVNVKIQIINAYFYKGERAIIQNVGSINRTYYNYINIQKNTN